MTYDELIQALTAEKHAPKPEPYRNERHDYAAEIEALREAFARLEREGEAA